MLTSEFFFIGRSWATSMLHLVDPPQNRCIDRHPANMIPATRLSNIWASRCRTRVSPEQNSFDLQRNCQLFVPVQNLVNPEVLDRSMGMQSVVVGTLQQMSEWTAGCDTLLWFSHLPWAAEPSQVCDMSQQPQSSGGKELLLSLVNKACNLWLVKEHYFSDYGKTSYDFDVCAHMYGRMLANY